MRVRDLIAAQAAYDRQLHPELRRGQSIYNAAYKLMPDFVNSLDGTDLDPYYVDGRIESFLEACDAAKQPEG